MPIGQPSNPATKLDLEGVAQRIVELAQMCATEHLRTIARSQAQGLMELARQSQLQEQAELN